MTSQQLTVAGLVDVKLELAELPHDTTIIAVAGIVDQAYSIVYRDPGLVARPTASTRRGSPRPGR